MIKTPCGNMFHKGFHFIDDTKVRSKYSEFMLQKDRLKSWFQRDPDPLKEYPPVRR